MRLMRRGAVLRWRRDSTRDVWRHDRAGAARQRRAGRPRQLALADLDGDGAQELLFSIAGGWQAASVGDDRLVPFVQCSTAVPRALAARQHRICQAGRRLSAPMADAVARDLAAWPRAFSIHGTEPDRPGGSRRFHAFERVGNRDARRFAGGFALERAYSTLRSHSGPGQSLQPLFVGLAGYAVRRFRRADLVGRRVSDRA